MSIMAVLFDFDGTLADSFGAITASTNHVRTHFGLPALPEAVIREYVGFGLPHLMTTLLPEVPTDDAVRCYRQHHPTVMMTGTTLLPGVADTLQELRHRKLKMAVCSNKAVMFTKQLVESLQLQPIFDVVLGPDDVGAPKPDPAMLLEAIRRLGVSKNEAVYVGDMAIDVHTARRAGIPVWIVPGGATGLESPESAGPDKILTRFEDLLVLLPEPSHGPAD